MVKKIIDELNDFWPCYLSHHRHRANRAAHDIADIIVLGASVYGLASRNPLLVVIGVVAGYAVVFVSHFLIEKNTPATFGHPLLAGLSNWRMFALMLMGRLDGEFERHGLLQYGKAPWGIDALRVRVIHAMRNIV
jgi:hypothetical protein